MFEWSPGFGTETCEKFQKLWKPLSRFYTLYVYKIHTFRNLCGDDGEEVSSLLYEPMRSLRIMSCKQLWFFNSFNWIQQWKIFRRFFDSTAVLKWVVCSLINKIRNELSKIQISLKKNFWWFYEHFLLFVFSVQY